MLIRCYKNTRADIICTVTDCYDYNEYTNNTKFKLFYIECILKFIMMFFKNKFLNF